MGYGVKTYYGVRELADAILLPLNEHWDVCPVMRINIRFRFPLGLLTGKWRYKELRLPAQEGVGLGIDNVPDIRRIAYARIGDCEYVPACS